MSPFVNGRQPWRLSIKATCWSDSGPNRIPGSRREISRARSKLPPLHGGGRGGLGLGALLGGPSLGVGQIGVGARPGRLFLSAGAHGRSRRFSVLVTSWGVSCPNGVARDRRGTSCAPRHPPPLPGLCPAGTAEASPGARVPSRFWMAPRCGRPFLSHGAVGPSRGHCGPPTLRVRLPPGGVAGACRGGPPGAPCPR